MPSSRLQFASVALRFACLGSWLVGAPVISHAATAGATFTDPCGTATASREVTASDLAPGLWRLVGGDASAVFPYDPAHFVGPPVPLAILFAPAPAPVMAGMRIELEPGATPVATRGIAPKPEPIVRYEDVISRLVPVRHPDGSLSVDLTGITMADTEAWIDADGVHFTDGVMPVVR